MKCRHCQHGEMSHQFRHTQGTYWCSDCADWCDYEGVVDIQDYFENVIHTAHKDVPAIEVLTAGEFLIKMASLNEHVAIYFDENLFVTVDTGTDGLYRFAIDSEHNTLIVDQIT